MFEAKILDSGEVYFSGRLDASQTEKADKVLQEVTASRTINLKDLEYISSAGLGVLLANQKRLKTAGHGLTLINMNKHIRDIFTLTGFDRIFVIL